MKAHTHTVHQLTCILYNERDGTEGTNEPDSNYLYLMIVADKKNILLDARMTMLVVVVQVYGLWRPTYRKDEIIYRNKIVSRSIDKTMEIVIKATDDDIRRFYYS